MEVGQRYLGFLVPLELVWRQGSLDRVPGRGVCAECGHRRERVHIRWDGAVYCIYCIHFDLASAGPAAGQKRPPEQPVETMWQKADKRDRFDLTFWSKALPT